MFSKSTIKYIQSLQHKKFRDHYNVFIAEGPKVVSELLQAGIFTCRLVYATEDWVTATDKRTIGLAGESLEIIKEYDLEKISHYSTANKVVAVFEKLPAVEIFSLKNKLQLVLDDIQDPGNLGTIIRTADWFGIEHIICSGNTADLYNPKVVQSTMASLGRVNVIYTELAGWLQRAGNIKKMATTLTGKPVGQLKAVKEGLIIIGNESKGISEPILKLADEKISISKSGHAESLNAAVATGIILYALTS